MTTKYLFLALLSFSLMVVSCKKEEEAATTEAQTNATESVTTPTITTTPAAATPTGEKPALNPAHGEPYHRCDIAVGAPLDGPATQQGDSPAQKSAGPKSFFKTVQDENASAASATPTPMATTTATPAQAQTQTQPAATATPNTPKPKNNPAHGQPHHRCDIAVGAPLPDA